MALDKFQPYLFVSAGEQSNKYLTPAISPDGIASFQAQRAQDLTGLTVRIDPIQEGTGDPSPTNIRPISGRTGMTVTVQSGETQNEYSVTWETIAGTVYGGTLDVVSGVLTVDRGFAELSEDWKWRKSSSYPGGYIVNRDVVPGTAKFRIPFVCSHAKTVTQNENYVFGTCYCDVSLNFRIMGESSTIQDWKDYITAQRTAGTPVQICYYIDTPQTYQLTGAEVRTLAGFNQIYSDAGPVIDIKF